MELVTLRKISLETLIDVPGLTKVLVLQTLVNYLELDQENVTAQDPVGLTLLQLTVTILGQELVWRPAGVALVTLLVVAREATLVSVKAILVKKSVN